MGEGWIRVLNLTGKQPKIRKLSAPNAYSKLYFTTKIKPVVERWEKVYLEKNPQHKPGDKIPHWRIPFQNAILHELWNAKPDELKNDVRRQFGLNDDDSEGDLQSAEPDEAEEDGDGSDRAERERVERLRGYQRCVSPVHEHSYSDDPHSSNIRGPQRHDDDGLEGDRVGRRDSSAPFCSPVPNLLEGETSLLLSSFV